MKFSFFLSPAQVPFNMSDSSSTWFLTYTKLRFFTRIRRFLQLKTSSKRPDKLVNKLRVADISEEAKGHKQEGEEEGMENGEENDFRDDWVVLQRSVKRLLFGSSWEDKEVAAREIKRLAAAVEDVKRRKMMAELGVIPPLVGMVASEVVEHRRLAIQALIELANGCYTNRALMLEAGILDILPKNVSTLEESAMHEIAQLLLSISSLSLANSKFSAASSGIVTFLVRILELNSSFETQELCLSTLYNFSTEIDNAASLASNGTVNILLRLSSVKETAEKSLATLGNLVLTLMGKKALEGNEMIPESLIEILTWEEKPKCQELSAYILMILAHQSSAQRVKMSKARIVPILLEVALLSSPLAQKRALKLLEWFKDERLGPHSGPQTRRVSIGSPVNQREVNVGKKFMKKIVKQSLYKNMETITRRANGVEESSKLKVLALSSSSKSLPY